MQVTQMNFKNNVTVWKVAAFVILMLAIVRGVRFPHFYPYTQALLSYEFGFIKRGLLGTVLSGVFGDVAYHFWFFSLVSFVVLFVVIYLFWLILRDLIETNNPIHIFAALIFAASPSLIHMININGHFEFYGMLVTLLVFRLKGFNNKFIAATVGMILAILIHEINFIVFVPTIILLLFCSIEPNKQNLQFMGVVCFGLVMAIVTFALLNHAVSDEGIKYKLYLLANERTDLDNVYFEAFKIIGRNLEDNANIVGLSFWARPVILFEIAIALSVLLPQLLFFMFLSYKLFSMARVNILFVLLAMFASLSPFLLYLVAFDFVRWDSLVGVVCFLVYVIAATSQPKTALLLKNKDESSSAPINVGKYVPIAVFLLFFSAMSSMPMWSGYQAKMYPFFDHHKYFFHLATGQDSFPSKPEYDARNIKIIEEHSEEIEKYRRLMQKDK